MSDDYRTWVLLEGGRDGCQAYRNISPSFTTTKRVEVIEKAYVDAERERLLDLLEEALVGGIIAKGIRERIAAALREYGRLLKEES